MSARELEELELARVAAAGRWNDSPAAERYQTLLTLRGPALIALAREAIGAREIARRLKHQGHATRCFLELPARMKDELAQLARQQGLDGWAACGRRIIINAVNGR